MSNDNNEIAPKRGRGRPKGSPNKRTLYLENVLKSRFIIASQDFSKNEKIIRKRFKELALGQPLTGDITVNDGSLTLQGGQVLTEELIDSLNVDIYPYLPLDPRIELAFETKWGRLYRTRNKLKKRIANYNEWLKERLPPRKMGRRLYLEDNG